MTSWAPVTKIATLTAHKDDVMSIPGKRYLAKTIGQYIIGHITFSWCYNVDDDGAFAIIGPKGRMKRLHAATVGRKSDEINHMFDTFIAS